MLIIGMMGLTDLVRSVHIAMNQEDMPTFQFKGLDEFLVEVRKLIKSDESNASD